MAEVFVFGSNLRGAHGKGAALFARLHRGAIPGQAEGPQGNSYAIPTKDARLRTLPLTDIAAAVERFLTYVRANPDTAFEVTAIGCGLAGLTPPQVAPLFAHAPPNCRLPERFLTFVPQRGQPLVRAQVHRNAGHPWDSRPGFDQMLLFAATEPDLDAAIAIAERKFWAVWIRDSTGEISAILYKPAPADAPREDASIPPR